MVFESPATFRRALAIVIVLVFHAPTANLAAVQSNDFGFRFEFGPCSPWVTERLDTFSGVFEANLGGEPTRTATARMSLTDAQMTAIYRAVENIGFFDYPSKFIGVPSGVRETTATSPAPTYRLEVRKEGAVHIVAWEDAYKPSSAEADRLRDLFSMVRDFIHEHQEFKRLPRPSVGCE